MPDDDELDLPALSQETQARLLRVLEERNESSAMWRGSTSAQLEQVQSELMRTQEVAYRNHAEIEKIGRIAVHRSAEIAQMQEQLQQLQEFRESAKPLMYIEKHLRDLVVIARTLRYVGIAILSVTPVVVSVYLAFS